MHAILERKNVAIFFILLVSAALRLYKLGQIPEGFHADEAAFGYNAYSILKTGTDEYGQKFPLVLKSFGDYKGAMYSYLTIPSIAFFGLNEFAVRLPTAIFGIAFVALVMLLSYQLYKSRLFMIVVGVVAGLSPVGITLSRVQSDPLVSVVIALFGIALYIQYLDTGAKRIFILACFCFIVSMYTNTLPRLFLLFIIPLVTYFRVKKIGTAQRNIIFLTFILVVFVNIILAGGSIERLGQVSVIGRADVLLPLDEKIREDGTGANRALTRLFHNKISAHGQYFLKNYFSYMSYDFLFSEASQPSREKIVGVGIAHLIELPFFLIGLYVVVHRRSRTDLLLLTWFFVSPVLLLFASDETPNIHRFLIAIVPMYMIIASGITHVITSRARTHVWLYSSFVCVLYIVSQVSYMHALFVHQPSHDPYYRGYANKQLVGELAKYTSDVDQIIYTKSLASPYIYILFYTAYDPKKYQSYGSPRDLDNTGFDKYMFIPRDCPSMDLLYAKRVLAGEKLLFVNRAGCKIYKSQNLLSTINWHNSLGAFQIVSYDVDKLRLAGEAIEQ